MRLGRITSSFGPTRADAHRGAAPGAPSAQHGRVEARGLGSVFFSGVPADLSRLLTKSNASANLGQVKHSEKDLALRNGQAGNKSVEIGPRG